MLELVTPDYVNPNLHRVHPMTVGVLIQKLQTCDPNKPVRLAGDGFNEADMPYFGCSEGEYDVLLGTLIDPFIEVDGDWT